MILQDLVLLNLVFTGVGQPNPVEIVRDMVVEEDVTVGVLHLDCTAVPCERVAPDPDVGCVPTVEADTDVVPIEDVVLDLRSLRVRKSDAVSPPRDDDVLDRHVGERLCVRSDLSDEHTDL